MTIRPQLLGTSALALRDLLLIAADADCESDDPDSGRDLLREHVESLFEKSPPADVPKSSNRATLDVLLDANEPIATFVLLKDYFKDASSVWESADEADAARVLYYAAIAGAAAHHGVNITTLAEEERDDAFNYLASIGWMQPQLVRIFLHALEVPEGEARQVRLPKKL